MMKNLITLIFSLFVSFQSLAEFKPDFNEGLAAYQSGDYETALLHWVTLANEGYADAQYYLGVMYANGEGVLENDKTAVKWYTKAAEQGDADAQYNLGNKYNDGKGVPENHKTAVHWWTKAAEQGYANAQFMYAFMIQSGEGGKSDPPKAMVWALLAEKNGKKDTVAITVPSSMTMTELEISTAERIANECYQSNYQNCPE